MHRDAVLEQPKGVSILAKTDICANQCMYRAGRLFSVQGHPEFTEEIVREILDIRRDAHIVTEELYQDGIDRAANAHNGVAVAQAFLRFLHG